MVSVTPHDFRDPQYCKHCGNLLFGAKPAALDPNETRARAVGYYECFDCGVGYIRIFLDVFEIHPADALSIETLSSIVVRLHDVCSGLEARVINLENRAIRSRSRTATNTIGQS